MSHVSPKRMTALVQVIKALTEINLLALCHGTLLAPGGGGSDGSGEFPFGIAGKFEKRWRYYINPERFRKWMAGEDLAPAAGEEC